MRLLSGEDTRVRAHLARAGLLALSPLYGLGVGVYRGMYDAGILRDERLPCPVVSVGNLTVGGTGKTGLVLSLTRMLQRWGLRAAVLNYGYRATATGPAVVGDGCAVRLSPAESGDEAALLARSLPGVPVLIGKRRIESGALAIREFDPDVLLLDDGFQYWRLARDIDLVLIDATEPWGFGALLPRGLLRELPGALRRAMAIVLTHARRVRPDRLAALHRDLSRLAPGIPRFEANYAATGLIDLETGALADPSDLRGSRAGVLSALGNPAQFEESVRQWKPAELVGYRFPDHHAYQTEEIDLVLRDAAARGLDRIVTSPKDAVKVRCISGIQAKPPIHVLESDLVVDPDAPFMEWLLRFLRSWGL